MTKEIWLCGALGVFGFTVPCNVLPQQTPSKPISEVRFRAGEGFSVEVELETPAPQDLRASATYTTGKSKDAPNGSGFSCRGNVSANQQKFQLSCSTQRLTPGGEYQGSGSLVLSRDETGDTQGRPDIRLPIVTIQANPYDVTQFPEIAATSLVLTKSQSLRDGALRAQDILDALNSYFPKNTKDSKENRRYLIAQLEGAKTLVHLTRKRYMYGENTVTKPPIFFEDFDRRFDLIIQDLGGSPSRKASFETIAAPRLILAQLPQAKDSIDAKTQPGTLDKRVGDFVSALTDMIKAFGVVGQSGTTSFSWSITTEPPGADIWYSRLGEPETKWAGSTNVKDQMLEYARWTFRVDWNGCWKKESPDPYFQNPVPMKLSQAGCSKR